MPKVRQAMYQCSKCEQYVPGSEHILRRVRMIGPKGVHVTQEYKNINQEYSEHLCLECMNEELAGKQTHEARRRRNVQEQDPEVSPEGEDQEPEPDAQDTRAA